VVDKKRAQSTVVPVVVVVVVVVAAARASPSPSSPSPVARRPSPVAHRRRARTVTRHGVEKVTSAVNLEAVFHRARARRIARAHRPRTRDGDIDGEG